MERKDHEWERIKREVQTTVREMRKDLLKGMPREEFEKKHAFWIEFLTLVSEEEEKCQNISTLNLVSKQ